jgi:uncharacterized protein (DUF983 family)
VEKIPYGTLASRAMRLRCPRCGGGKLFEGWFRMYERCPNCKLKYERDPGYFLGSAYVNYGLTALIVTGVYVPLRFLAKIEGRFLLGPLLVFCIVFPLFFFRHARAWWLAMDCHFDTEGFDPKND